MTSCNDNPSGSVYLITISSLLNFSQAILLHNLFLAISKVLILSSDFTLILIGRWSDVLSIQSSTISHDTMLSLTILLTRQWSMYEVPTASIQYVYNGPLHVVSPSMMCRLHLWITFSSTLALFVDWPENLGATWLPK